MKIRTERRNLLSRKVFRFFLAVRVPDYKKPRKVSLPIIRAWEVGTINELNGNKEK